ncbi:hypothetical protein [Clostridium tagluense]|uniref:Phage portal protein n=1 Tax=Clostridium tagluense TaxID=360422 RepID=A0A401ULM1_9CLOT|nr:hypothetical protein [Clostridium tagluense]GCD10431.1 hypothetical protein Ctaglu_20540 [Clostridium tagluense]
MADIIMTEKTEDEIKIEKTRMFFSAMANMKTRDLIKEQAQSSIFKTYKKEDIIGFLQNPAKNEVKIRKISQFIYDNSSHYKRLVQRFSTMHLLRYTLTPTKIDINKVKIDKFKQDYLDTSNMIDNMNIQHEFRKIMNVCFKEDVFYGYEYTSDNSYFIQQLDADYCKICTIEDGVYNFAFDFSYFAKYEYKLDMFPKEFKSKYNKYKRDTKAFKFQELDSDKTICIKVNDDIEYPLPPFIGVFEEVYNIQDYKMLKKAKTELDNYQLLGMKIPTKGDDVNDFMIDLDLAGDFFANISATLPSNVGLFLTPMDVIPMKFEQDKLSNDSVTEAEDAFWSGAGVNGNLFNSKGNSGAVVALANKTDETIVFKLTRQMERWVNRKLKFLSKKYCYKFKFLDITTDNETEVIDGYLKLAQYGIPVKLDLAQAIGMTYADMVTKNWLENDVLNITETWRPLASSYTQSGDGTDIKNTTTPASGGKGKPTLPNKSSNVTE